MHDLSTFVVTIEMQDKTANTTPPPSSTTVGTQLHSWLTQFSTFHGDVLIRTKNGEKLTVANFPTNETELYTTFKYEVNNRRNRNVTVLLEIDTTQTFNSIKDPMIPWMKLNNMWMNRHTFKTKTTKTAKIGWILGRHCFSTYRDSLQKRLTQQMKHIIDSLTTDQRHQYYKSFNSEYEETDEPPELEIRLHNDKPSWRPSSNKRYYTEAIAITCPWQDRRLIGDLMANIFSQDDSLDTDHSQKFVPFALPYDKSLRNAEQAYIALIQEQNLYLANHAAIPLVVSVTIR